MLVEKLRGLVLAKNQRGFDPLPKAEEEEIVYQNLLNDAVSKMEEAARQGRSNVSILFINDFEEELIDLRYQDYGRDPDPEPGLVLSEGHRDFLMHVPVDQLRGAARRLYLHLKDVEGIRFDFNLQHRVEGKTCNSRRNVYDLIAYW